MQPHTPLSTNRQTDAWPTLDGFLPNVDTTLVCLFPPAQSQHSDIGFWEETWVAVVWIRPFCLDWALVSLTSRQWHFPVDENQNKNFTVLDNWNSSNTVLFYGSCFYNCRHWLKMLFVIISVFTGLNSASQSDIWLALLWHHFID